MLMIDGELFLVGILLAVSLQQGNLVFASRSSHQKGAKVYQGSIFSTELVLDALERDA